MGLVVINIYPNSNATSKAYGKWYGRVKQESVVDAKMLCAHAALDSGIESADVAVVFDALFKQMKEQLCNGHPIVVEQFGTFKIGVSSSGVSLADIKKSYKQFDSATDDPRRYLNCGRMVKSVHLNFVPSKEVKEVLGSVKYETDKTEWAAQLEIEKAATGE